MLLVSMTVEEFIHNLRRGAKKYSYSSYFSGEDDEDDMTIPMILVLQALSIKSERDRCHQSQKLTQSSSTLKALNWIFWSHKKERMKRERYGEKENNQSRSSGKRETNNV